MKKWLLTFAALFCAIGAYAQNLNSYVPADAIFVGSANGTAILESNFIRRLIFISTQKTMEDILKEKGQTLEQAKKQCGVALFYLKVIPGNSAAVQMDGGAIVYGSAKDSCKDINNITQQSLDAELKKNADFLALAQHSGIKFELIKVAGKNSVLVSIPNQNFSTQFIVTGITDRMFQIRFATVKPAEKALLKPLKQYSALTKKIDGKALLSIAADVQTVTKLNPQMQQDPVANGIKVASASISEINNNLILQAEIEATSPDAANMLHAQINALITTLKNDPANKALADMMKLTLKGNNVEFKGVFPVDFVINAIKSTLANIPQQNVPGAAPVPAVPAAK